MSQRGVPLPMLSAPLASPSGAALEAEGWVRRFVAAPPRLAEAVQLYTQLGHEVHLEQVSPHELSDDCGDCWLALSLFRILYTRRLQ